ncbi:hypothetical protein [Hyphomonas sp. KY3]|jgi:uncharacterized protein YdcH (DUF465 family)|uniref:hypothetical protein n=1 Tax=Hyphomonas sp. KY3 TaxID=2016196 RepID=UPI001A8C8BE1|nr:hypothetical protein [Hyphomonas sp. KY3]QSR20978.1 hypothetical protein CFA77_01575 [Hyphomonas sp. KY3]
MAHSFAGLAGEFPTAVPEIFELASIDPVFAHRAEAFEEITQVLAEAETSIEDVTPQDRRALEARRAELRAQLYTALCNVTGDDRWCDEAAAGTEGPSPPPLPRRSAA